MTPAKMNRAALVQEVFALRDTNRLYKNEIKNLKLEQDKKVAMVAKDREIVVAAYMGKTIDYKEKSEQRRLKLEAKTKLHDRYVRDTRKKIILLEATVKELTESTAHFNKNKDWDKDRTRDIHVELILRTIVTYDKLIKQGVITFNELAFLLVATQKEVFNMNDIKSRFKVDHFCKSQFAACVEAGYFAKIHRRQLWNITHKGKERFNSIMKYIYEEKVGTYKVFRKDLVEE